MAELEIRAATEDDVPLILSLIEDLAEYERLSHEVVATEETLRDSLFGEQRVVETLLAYLGDDPAGFAPFFHNFSTFLGRSGIYLEDLYVRPEFRAWGWGGLCWSTSRGLRESEAAGGWSGQSWTGTNRPSASTRASEPLQ